VDVRVKVFAFACHFDFVPFFLEPPSRAEARLDAEVAVQAVGNGAAARFDAPQLVLLQRLPALDDAQALAMPLVRSWALAHAGTVVWNAFILGQN
jgi:hypothetical protein